MNRPADDGLSRGHGRDDGGLSSHAPRRLWLALLALTAVLVPLGLAFASISTAPLGQRNWYWQNPLPQGNPLYAVTSAGTGDAWAVDGGGVILHTSDSGAVWEAQDGNTAQTLNAIDFVSTTQGWAVGAGGTIRTTIDGGATWTTQTAGAATALRGVAMPSASVGWVVGNAGAIRATTDGGATWSAQVSNATGQLNAISAVSESTAWVVGNAVAGVATVRKTTDGGATWVAQSINTTADLNAVSFVDDQTGWVVGDAVGGVATVRKTTDGGATWTTQTVGAAQVLFGVTFVSPTTGWVVGNGGVIRYTSDGGSTWASQTSGPTGLRGVAAWSATKAVAVGLNGQALRTSDAGQTWIGQLGGTAQRLNAVSFPDTSTGYAAGAAGRVMRTEDGGMTWAGRTTGTGAWFGIDFPETQTGWVVGAAGAIRRTTDGGNTWLAQASNAAVQLSAVSAVSSQTAWAVGNAGTIRATVDGGSTWVSQASGVAGNLNGVFFIDGSTGWAVGAAGVIRHTDDGGATWTGQTSGVGSALYGVYFTDADNGWAVGANGVIRHTTNGGATWTAQPSGTTTLLYSVGMADATHGWVAGGAAGQPAVVRGTTDGGATWSAQQPGLTGQLRAVAPLGTSSAVIVGEAGGIRRTLDGGATWLSRTFGTLNALNDIALSDLLDGYAVGAAGTIVNSADGGQTWAVLVSGTTNQLRGVDLAGAADVWAVGDAGTIVHTADGTSWTGQSSATTSALRAVDVVDATHAWAAGDAGTILMTADGGATTWTAQPSTVSSPVAFYGVSFVDTQTGWAVGGATGQPATVVHTADGGSTWTTQPVGDGTTILRAVSFVDASNGWVVGDAGLVKRTADGGSTWTTQTAGTALPLFDVCFIDPLNGWAVGGAANNVSVIRRTIDGGATWTSQAPGTVNVLRAVRFLDADHGWTAGDGGTILRTTDNGVPVTTLTVDPPAPDGLGGWYVTAPTIYLASDKPGISYYRIVGGSPGPVSTYSTPFLYTTEGTSTLEYFSVDTADNHEATNSALFGVDLTPPSIPSPLAAAPVSSTVGVVDWHASADGGSGLDHYRVTLDSSLLGTTTATGVTITDLLPETRYTVGVSAADVAGNASAETTAAIMTYATMPRPPSAVYARGAYRGLVYVDWVEPTGTVGPVSYGVWRSDAGGPFQRLGVVDGFFNRTFVDTTAPDPTLLAYAVSVTDSRGAGSLSDMGSVFGSVVTSGPPPPSAVRALATTAGIETAWTAVPFPGVRYAVLRGTTATSAPATVTPGSIAATGWLDAAVTPHAEYWYRIVSIDASGEPGAVGLPVYVRAETTGPPGPHANFKKVDDPCALCHSAHTSVQDNLLRAPGTDETPLCFSCHDGTSASDVLGEFSDPSRVERHPVTAGPMPGGMRCGSCHDPHGAGGEIATGTILYVNGVRSGNGVCYGCHTATSTPVPLGDLRMFEGSGHASGVPDPPSGSQVKCLSCHGGHSGREPGMTQFTEDDRCLRCHSATGSYPGAADILAQLSGPSPDTRQQLLAADRAVTGGRIGCTNCHEPHSSTAATPLVDPRDPSTTGGWAGTRTDFCLQCHDGRPLPTSAETTPWALPPLASGGATIAANIAASWVDSFHGAGLPSAAQLRLDMGWQSGDRLSCLACHAPHGSQNKWGLRETVAAKFGTMTVEAVLVTPVGSGADFRSLCGACHSLTAASHPDASAGGADLSVFPIDCTSGGCHTHAGAGL